MAGAPWHHALKAAESVVAQLEPNDILSVVVYDDEVDSVVSPQAEVKTAPDGKSYIACGEIMRFVQPT